MRKFILVLFLMFTVAATTQAQTIRDDGKVTKREKRFLTRRIYGSDRKIRLQEWKDAKKARKVQAKEKRRNRKRFKEINANKRNWGTRKSRREHAKHYKAMKKGWLAREHPRKYVKESNYP